VLFTELACALYGLESAPLLVSYVGGLGGRDIAAEEFYEMARELRVSAGRRRAPPRLLYTEEELRQLRAQQAIATGAPEAIS
jgi:pyruvate ferredoxin oxidoreductase alpha subunit